MNRSGSQNIEQLHIVQSDLRLAVVPLDFMHLRQCPAVKLQIKLTVVDRQGFAAFFKLVHEGGYRGVFDDRHAVKSLGAVQKFQHGRGGAAASVTVAVGAQTHIAGVFIAVAVDDIVQRQNIGNKMGAIEVSYDLGTVDAAPEEGICGKMIQVSPTHFRGVEVRNTDALHDLGNGGTVAEGVR